MVNLMSSAYLHGSGDGNDTVTQTGNTSAAAAAAAANRFSKLTDAWVTGGSDGVETTTAASLSYTGLDGSPYMASPTPLHSPETPNLDQVLFPSQVGGDLGYLDTPFGEYSPDGYGGDASQFPLQFGHRTSTSLPEGYELSNSNNNSAASPGMYGGAGVWPAAAHMSPAAFLPTPPMGDELTGEDSVEEELTGSKRKRRSAATDDAAAAGNVGKRKSKRAQTQLRTASRAPKKRTANTIHKPAESAEEVKARAAHNQVEQQYRKRLNAHFEKLLAVLPPPDEIDGITSSGGGARDGIGDRRVSKAEVLDMARQRIRALERETAALERERRELRGRIGGFEGQWRRGAPL